MTKDNIHQETADLEQPLLAYEQQDEEERTTRIAAVASPCSPQSRPRHRSYPLQDATPVIEAALVVAEPEEGEVTAEDRTCYYADSPDTNTIQRTTTPSSSRAATTTRRTGQWKDGIFNCCAHGCCHPSLVYPWCCPLIGIGQVMGRLDLNFCGQRVSKCQSNLTFMLLITLWISIFIYNSAVYMDSEEKIVDPDNSSILNEWIHVILSSTFLSVFLFYLIVVTRRYIRKRYSIPPHCCGVCDDCCATAFFPCCTISQMMRHTAPDYAVYRAVWFSKTGLPNGVAERDYRGAAYSANHDVL